MFACQIIIHLSLTFKLLHFTSILLSWLAINATQKLGRILLPFAAACTQQRSLYYRFSALGTWGLHPFSLDSRTQIFPWWNCLWVWSEPAFLTHTILQPIVLCWVWAHDPLCCPVCSILLGVGTWPVQIWSGLTLNIFSRNESDLFFCCLDSGLWPC